MPYLKQWRQLTPTLKAIADYKHYIIDMSMLLAGKPVKQWLLTPRRRRVLSDNIEMSPWVGYPIS